MEYDLSSAATSERVRVAAHIAVGERAVRIHTLPPRDLLLLFVLLSTLKGWAAVTCIVGVVLCPLGPQRFRIEPGDAWWMLDEANAVEFLYSHYSPADKRSTKLLHVPMGDRNLN
jgi:hypothetical protein